MSDSLTEAAGFLAAALSGAAYVPQIWHLAHEHCSAGISRVAFRVWLVAALLFAVRAVDMREPAFIALAGTQVVATTIILIYATKYKNRYCPTHAPSVTAP